MKNHIFTLFVISIILTGCKDEKPAAQVPAASPVTQNQEQVNLIYTNPEAAKPFPAPRQKKPGNW